MLKIELRKVAHLKGLSEETPCYTAQVWVDGVHFCDASNHGHGGCDDVVPPKGIARNDQRFHAALGELNERIAREYPQIDLASVGGKGTMEQDLEMVCHGLLADRETAATVKRDLRSKVMFQKAGTRGLWSVKKRPGATDAQMIAAVKAAHPGALVLNEVAFDEAVRLYSVAE